MLDKYFPFVDFSNTAAQFLYGMVLMENPSDSQPDHLQRIAIWKPRGNQEDLSIKSELFQIQ